MNVVDQAWRELCEVDDRTSPPEYPDMCLITRDELARFMSWREEQHPDDVAVDRFAEAMKAKLAKKRAEGYGGWNDPSACTVQFLAEQLIAHLAKGDPVDIGNFAMMLFNRYGGCFALQEAASARAE